MSSMGPSDAGAALISMGARRGWTRELSEWHPTVTARAAAIRLYAARLEVSSCMSVSMNGWADAPRGGVHGAWVAGAPPTVQGIRSFDLARRDLQHPRDALAVGAISLHAVADVAQLDLARRARDGARGVVEQR